jgi:hypothetical protein
MAQRRDRQQRAALHGDLELAGRELDDRAGHVT